MEMRKQKLALTLAVLLGAHLLVLNAYSQEPAQQAAKIGPSDLTVAGSTSKPSAEFSLSFSNTISAADMKKMPRITVQVMNSHTQKQETYEGVALALLLKQVGLPQGERLRGGSMTLCIVAEAADGYRVTYSLAEIDPSIGDSGVIVADTMDGAPLGAGEGVFKLVAPHDKRPARWVRMLKSLTVVQLPKS
jgi:hypothetical protein